MDYRRGGHRRPGADESGRAMDGGDPRTPMAWQHRDTISYESSVRTPNSSRYRSPGPRERDTATPSSSSRRERGQSVDRYSSRSNRSKGRQSQSSRTYGPPGHLGGYRGGGGGQQPPSHTSTEGETTETDSQPPPTVDNRSDYTGPMIPGYPVMVPMSYPMFPPSLPMVVPGTGSIRSVQSVPMLSPQAHTWDGEPCPVHHQPMVPLAALYGMGGSMGYPPPAFSYGHSSVPPSLISGATTVRRARSVAEMSVAGGNRNYPGGEMDDRKSFHASMASLGPSTMMMAGPPHPHHPHGRHPQQPQHPHHHNGGRVVVGENGTPSHLPTRDHGHKISPIPGKDPEKDVLNCCSGHTVVLWIILGIITFGVLLGIVLKFTIS